MGKIGKAEKASFGSTEFHIGLPEQDKTPTDNQEAVSDDKEVLRRVQLYRKFGGRLCEIANALGFTDEESESDTADALESVDAPEESAESQERMPEDDQIEALIAQARSELEIVDRSLQNQADYMIVNHKQINTKEALEHELQSGTGIPELDIRFDKDGKPWISHSQRAGARFFFSKPIHELSSEEVAKIGKRLSLEDGLDIFRQYHEDNPNHRVVLEIKELGPDKESAMQYLEKIRSMLEENGIVDSAIFATLSPSILRSVHDAFPDNPKILNGGIAPIISYDIANKSSEDAEPAAEEHAIKVPNVELFFSNATEIVERADGYGKQTGYLWTRLPRETVATLRQMNEKGSVGAASLAVVNMFANALEKLLK